MRAFWAKYRKVLLSLLLLCAPLLFLYVNTKRERDLNPVDRFVLRVSAPVQNATRFVVDGLLDLWEDYVYLRDQRTANRRLSRELHNLGGVQAKLNETTTENERLRKLLDFHQRAPSIKKVPAKIIARSTSPYFRVYRVRIDTGGAPIENGMPVVTGDGVVGRVRGKYGTYADVQLVADPESSIDVIVQGTRATGFLRGRGESNNYRCRIEHLSLADSVREGDLVVTSGLGQGNRYPKGLVVGRVSHVIRKQFAVAQEVEVTPIVDFSKIEEVFVLMDGAGVFVPPPKVLPGGVTPRGAAATQSSAEMPAPPPPLKGGEDAADLASERMAPAPSIDPREVQRALRTGAPRLQEVVPKELVLPPARETAPPKEEAERPGIDLREVNEAIRTRANEEKKLKKKEKKPPRAEDVMPKNMGRE